MKQTSDNCAIFSSEYSKKANKRQSSFIIAFFVVLWALLSFYEHSQLVRVDAQSLFLFDENFFYNMMKSPAGLLAYAGCFLMQFFYYPALGATIFVLLLVAQFFLVKKVFSIPKEYSLLALVPSVLLVATNTQLGYLIYYIKHPGWYYVALLGIITVLLAIWLYRKLSFPASLFFILLWVSVGFPLFGMFAWFAAICMGAISLSKIFEKDGRNSIMRGVLPITFALLLSIVVPILYYYQYTTVSIENIHLSALPVYHLSIGSKTFKSTIIPYWVPFAILFLYILFLSLYSNRIKAITEKKHTIYMLLLAIIQLGFLYEYWYKDANFRIENQQDLAMWQEDWQKVADYARDAELPSRQIVLNKNIALLCLGKAGSEMFAYPDGSSEIDAPMNVHLTHTGGLMTYYSYGRFNFCYRWCVENAVEHGWKVEYLKHSVRCMLLSGEYAVAERYINILKHTLFHKSWAEDYEKFLNKEELIKKNPEFKLPLQMYFYPDVLDVDESFVEVYLLKNIPSYLYSDTPPLYAEAALMSVLTRKDRKMFWNTLVAYLSGRKVSRLPIHYQEAVVLYSNLDRNVDASQIPIDEAVRMRFSSFMKRAKQFKGQKEEEIAHHFKEDFGDTYWYFYFFVRGIKSN
ncbi:MAG: hypothetical protein IKJ31_01550 [Bacteroidaceae bacterium]|nr:hypothetical protein [Bacteroidaceae bacterium]